MSLQLLVMHSGTDPLTVHPSFWELHLCLFKWHYSDNGLVKAKTVELCMSDVSTMCVGHVVPLPCVFAHINIYCSSLCRMYIAVCMKWNQSIFQPHFVWRCLFLVRFVSFWSDALSLVTCITWCILPSDDMQAWCMLWLFCQFDIL